MAPAARIVAPPFAPLSQPIKKKASQMGRPRHLGLFLGRKIEKAVVIEVVAQVWSMMIHLDEVRFDAEAAGNLLWY